MEKPKFEKKPSISTNKFVEDFDFVYETLRTYYPYFEVNKIVNNVDWLENREMYRQKILQCKTDTDFYETMNRILFDLNNDHTHLLPVEMGLFLCGLYRNMGKPNWRVDMVDIFEKAKVKERYEVSNENIDKVLKSWTSYEADEVNNGNVVIGDIISYEVGYMWIKGMINPD